MPDYKNHARPGGFQKRGPAAFGIGAPKTLYDAECNSCHQRCQVPFRPNGKKPVYCSNCFTKDSGAAAPRRDFGNREYAPRPMRAAAPQVPDRQLQDLNAQMKLMNETLGKLVVAVDTLNRATALTNEIRKHVPADAAEKTVPAKKKVAAKAAKKAPKA